MESSTDAKQKLDEISFHHYSLILGTEEVIEKIKDVTFILVAGDVYRAEAQANYLSEKVSFWSDTQPQHELEKLTHPKSRFTLFKIGPVLISNHGMGPASMSIALHELLLMSKQAGILKNITIIRFGTCGGIGVKPGTICITNRALNPLLQEYVEYYICFKVVRRQSVVDQETAKHIEKLALAYPNRRELGDYDVKVGTTIGTNDFYEEQGRTNGAICDHTQEDKLEFLNKIKDAGVINMEMESNYLAAMCHKLDVKFGIICVALNNRLLDDKVKLTDEEKALFERRLFWLNLILLRDQNPPYSDDMGGSLVEQPWFD